MTEGIEVTAETVITVKLTAAYASKLEASLSRALTAIGRMDHDRRAQLVNTHTVDDLLALRQSLLSVLRP